MWLYFAVSNKAKHTYVNLNCSNKMKLAFKVSKISIHSYLMLSKVFQKRIVYFAAQMVCMNFVLKELEIQGHSKRGGKERISNGILVSVWFIEGIAQSQLLNSTATSYREKCHVGRNVAGRNVVASNEQQSNLIRPPIELLNKSSNRLCRTLFLIKMNLKILFLASNNQTSKIV